MCFAMRSDVLCKSCDVEIAQDAGGVYKTGGKEKGGVGGKKGYIFSSSCDFLVQLVRYDYFDSHPAFCWIMSRTWPSLHLAQPRGS